MKNKKYNQRGGKKDCDNYPIEECPVDCKKVPEQVQSKEVATTIENGDESTTTTKSYTNAYCTNKDEFQNISGGSKKTKSKTKKMKIKKRKRKNVKPLVKGGSLHQLIVPASLYFTQRRLMKKYLATKKHKVK